MSPSSAVKLLLGVAMLGIGVFVALRPLWTHNGMLTGTRWLDLTFAFVFILRGFLNVRTVINRTRA
ncbi:MAG: hypothetical protein ABI442_08290 [Gemmatimonadaceae bacterium]